MIPAVSGSTGGSGGLPYQWVAVGSSGVLATSTSTLADTWTNQTSSFGTDNIRTVASNGQNMYVAGGDAGKIATSPDGITWTQQTSSFGTSVIRCLTWANGTWLAGGDSGKIATSTDGITWTQRTSGVATTIRSVAYGNSLWALGTTLGGLRTASDPTSTWTARTSTLTADVWLYYDKGDALWHAGCDTGTTGALATSPDGTTWTARNSTISSGTAGDPLYWASTATLIVNAQTGATGTSWDAQTSTTGTTWTNQTPAVTTFGPKALEVDTSGLFAFFGNNGTNNSVQTTTDGVTWTSRTAPGWGTNALQSACFSAGPPSTR